MNCKKEKEDGFRVFGYSEKSLCQEKSWFGFEDGGGKEEEGDKR